MRSREHILVSTLFTEAWRAGTNLDLPALIAQVQTPPITKVGVLDLESFYPAKDRFALAMQLNQLLAAPGFAAWLQGEPLEHRSAALRRRTASRASASSRSPTSTTRSACSSCRCCSTSWSAGCAASAARRACGRWSTSTRSSGSCRRWPIRRRKAPLLTLLKQARAFGLGLTVATQNPVDLDYKALANAGTWMLGRLQTDRDKARVLDGLEGAAGSAGTGFDRAKLDRAAVVARQARVPAAQRARQGAGAVRNALGALVSARTARAG